MCNFNNIKRTYDANEYIELRESDLYPPFDDRLHTFGIDDIDGGDSYDDYVKWFWEEYEHEIYDII